MLNPSLFFFGNKAVEEITNENVVRFNHQFIIEKQYSVSYQRQMVSALKLFFEQLEHKNLDIEKLERPCQSEFIIFSGQKEHSDEPIKMAQEFIENNYEHKLNIGTIAERVHLNGRSFIRRFKKATSNTPIEYIQRVRIEAAKKKLESTADTIMQVMFSIGYNDEKAFRSTFKKYSGLSPKEYQMKYNIEIAYA